MLSVCRVPFGSTDTDLQPAIELYRDGQIQQALRYVHLCQVACPWQSADQFCLGLILAMLNLEADQPDDAWHQMQLALSWRNKREQEAVLLDALPAITTREWLAMATVALHTNDCHTAEVYATEAIARIGNRPSIWVSDQFRDTYADAMTVLATVRLGQGRFLESELLLQLSRDAHAQAGDPEQVVVDLILSADVQLQSGNVDTAGHLIVQAKHVLAGECTDERHHRQELLRQAIEQRLRTIRQLTERHRARLN
ncbi:MAG TPA: hypothetical protein EYG03_05530 [Planctomycetes bacterium]|nr:hypothetical protein [Fuerstiella sp.]HIK91433.1 hypothetical protein [Planctomycetota bacterium]